MKPFLIIIDTDVRQTVKEDLTKTNAALYDDCGNSAAIIMENILKRRLMGVEFTSLWGTPKSGR